MPSPTILRTLICTDCRASHQIKCVTSRNYDSWKCRPCSIKVKWADPTYRSHRCQPKPKLKITPEERARRISESLRGRTLSVDHKAKISLAVHEKWAEPEYHIARMLAMNTPESKLVKSISSAAMWTDAFRLKMQGVKADPLYLERQSQASIKLWSDPEYRRKIIAIKSTPEFKAKMAVIQSDPQYLSKLAVARLNQPKVSSIQLTLYSILDDLGVQYYREYQDRPDDHQCAIGPYNVDCVIPRSSRSIIIECQGDYWHSGDRKVRIDAAKATYLTKYCSDQYDLKYLWEHEFSCPDKIRATIRYWLNLDEPSQVIYALGDLTISNPQANEYKLLLSKYHYLPNAGRGGIVFGAYLANDIIAVCVFSPTVRQNVQDGQDGIRELSRYCVHPNYRNKNLGSWFISRAIRSLPSHYDRIVSYCDTTFNHNGSIYRACNFVLDGEVPADYWYRSNDGWVMHKKTLYNRAIKMGMTEAEYAIKYDYVKIFGRPKLRFVFNRSQ